MKNLTNGHRPPHHLSPESRRIWREIVAEYGIGDSGGLRILRVALESFDRAQACRRAIDGDGLTVVDRFGIPKPHPLLASERDNRAAFLNGLRLLNLDLEPLRDRPGRPTR